MKNTFVVETDEEGFTRALIGPFKNWEAARKWADKKEAAYVGHLQEPFEVINASPAPK